ncbi:MAG: hypothetical protein HDT28_05405 [Clostridiales bacterium]|nr:hypothetical protein [Clostridiales bacterium]
MKKKLFILLALVLCLTPVFGLVACNSDADLQCKVKYICDDSNLRGEDDYKKEYVIFSKNGYGLYHYYLEHLASGSYYYESYTLEYTIKFKYSYLDADKSTIACYYDSISYGDKHTEEKPKNGHNSWSKMFTVSKNLLMSSDGKTFINEDYLDEEIPNYKKVENKD